MKRSPETAKLEAVLRSTKLVSGGFLADDPRPLDEIIEADAADLAALDQTTGDVAGRMRHITELCTAGLGSTVTIDDHLEARILEVRGMVSCPWPHPAWFPKTVVTATRTDTGESVRWSPLNVHMIEEHGFFEGRGSTFRLDPATLVRVIF